MTRTQVLQEIRRMRFEEAYGGWQERRRRPALRSDDHRTRFRPNLAPPWRAALEARRASTNRVTARDRGKHYAEQIGVLFVFLSNGEEVQLLDREADAHARTENPARLSALRAVRSGPRMPTLAQKFPHDHRGR